MGKTKKIRQKINDYIHKHDICCEKQELAMINRRMVIEQLLRLYEEIAEWRKDKGNFNYLAMDILYLMQRTKDDDFPLFQSIERKMYKKDKYDKERIRAFLYEVPLYYLMSLLGYAHYLHELVLSDKLP
jgi:hypothetical protein